MPMPRAAPDLRRASFCRIRRPTSGWRTTSAKFLGSRGTEVLDPADLPGPGQNLAADIEIELRKADCLVALVFDRSGRSVISEIDPALKSRTPVVAVEITDTHPPLPSRVLRLTLRDGNDVEGIG
jgi:hypothetical protein